MHESFLKHKFKTKWRNDVIFSILIVDASRNKFVLKNICMLQFIFASKDYLKNNNF